MFKYKIIFIYKKAHEIIYTNDIKRYNYLFEINTNFKIFELTYTKEGGKRYDKRITNYL
mgnify:CR=1 FL=1